MKIPHPPIRRRVADALLSHTRAPLHFLRAGLVLAATTLACSAGAAVINIDVSGISGVNGGVTYGNQSQISNWPVNPSGKLKLENGSAEGRHGLDVDTVGGIYKLQLGITSYNYTSPKNFATGASIFSDSTFSESAYFTLFKFIDNESPDFGAGSYLGFYFGQTGSLNYGWIEATWSGATDTFQIYSAAYESCVNTAILAGSYVSQGTCPAPVPAPSTLPLMGLALGALVFAGYRQRHSQRQQRV